MKTGFEPSDPEWDILGKASRPAPREGFAEAVRLALDSQDETPKLIRFPAARSWTARLLAAAAAAALLAVALSNLLRSPDSGSSGLAGGSAETPSAALSPSSPAAEEEDADEEITGLFTLERLLSAQDVESLEDEDLVALLY